MSEKELREKLMEQDKFFEQLEEMSAVYGIVLELHGTTATVKSGDDVRRVTITAIVPDLKMGDEVLLVPPTYQIIGMSERTKRMGSIVSLKQRASKGRWLVEVEGETRMALVLDSLKHELKTGIEAVLDPTGSVIVEILPQEKSPYSHSSANVKWDEIGGNEEAKVELKDAISYLRGGSDIFKAYNLTPPKGFLLYGPTGCGKTMLGKAVATDLADDGEGSFLYVKAPELLNEYVGVTERRIRALFASAKSHKERTGKTCVIFIDECDALLQKRGTGVSSDIEKTIVPTFLTEMDGLDESAALVILATNRADALDTAIIRDGRIDRKILIDRPKQEHAAEIIKLNLDGLPFAEGETMDMLVEAGTSILFDTEHRISKNVSGALIAGAISRAKTLAIRRDVENKEVGGIKMEDVAIAFLKAEQEHV